MLEDRVPGKWIPPTRNEVRDAVLTIKGLKGKVIRSYSLDMAKDSIFMMGNWGNKLS